MSTATESPAEAATETSTATAEAEVTPTPESTTPASEAPATKPAKAAVGAESYSEIKARALKGEAAPELQEESATVETSTETLPAAETSTETPPATETPTEPEPAIETPVAAAETDTDEKTPERIRLTGLKDGHLVALANKLARDEGITFTEAFARVSPKPAEAVTTTSTTATSGPQLRSRADVEAEIKAARQERKAAATSADNLETGAATKMVEAEEKIETLHGELAQIEYAEAEAEAEQENNARIAFENKANESKVKAVQYWPEAEDANSALSKRVLELADQYEKDPNLSHLVSEAESPFYFTQIAAQQLGLAPAHLRPAKPANGATPPPKPSASTATKPAPVNQRAVGRPTQPATAAPASGEARTTQENAEDRLGLDKVHSPHEYHKLKGQLTGQRY